MSLQTTEKQVIELQVLELNEEIKEAIKSFRNSIRDDSIEGFLSSITRLDQTRIYTIYSTLNNVEFYESPYTFEAFIKEHYLNPLKKTYSNTTKYRCFDHKLHFDANDVPFILLYESQYSENVYGEMNNKAMRINIGIDVELSKNKVIQKWKVSLLADHYSFNQ